MISVLLRLHRFSAGTLRQALRATLKSTLARKALEREGSERDGSVRPDGTSSAALLETHGHLILSGSACMQAGIPLSEIQKLGQWKTDTYLLYVRDSVFRNHIRDGLVQSMVDFHMESV